MAADLLRCRRPTATSRAGVEPASPREARDFRTGSGDAATLLCRASPLIVGDTADPGNRVSGRARSGV